MLPPLSKFSSNPEMRFHTSEEAFLECYRYITGGIPNYHQITDGCCGRETAREHLSHTSDASFPQGQEGYLFLEIRDLKTEAITYQAGYSRDGEEIAILEPVLNEGMYVMKIIRECSKDRYIWDLLKMNNVVVTYYDP